MLPILLFELKYRLRRPATYGYFFILFLMSLMFVSTKGIQIGGAVGQVFRNAPFIINQVTAVMMIFGTLIISAVMGVPIYRDFEHRFHEIMFTTPVKKWQYLTGRFLGSYIICILILSSIVWGIFVGQFMPWTDKEVLGPIVPLAYIQPIINYILPNTLLLGAIFFASGSYFRSQLAIYVQGVLFISAYIMINTLISDADTNPIYTLLDPFGLSATQIVTKYWTTADKNVQIVPLQSWLLYNRLIWTAVGLVFSALFFRFFQFTKAAPSFGKKKKSTDLNDTPTAALTLPDLALPFVPQDFSWAASVKKWAFLTRFHTRNILRSVPFIAITLCGIFILATNSVQIGQLGDTPTLPLTYMVMDVVTGSFALFILIIITFYVGELVWKEREVQLSGIIDASPLSSTVNLVAKFGAMVLVEAMLLAIIMVAGIAIQLYRGFADIDYVLYLKYLYLYTLPGYVLLTLLAFFVHNIVSNKFVGHVFMIMYYVFNIVLFALDINHNMLYYGNKPEVTYSGMNGFGHFVKPVLAFTTYWGLLGAAMFVAATLLYQRGIETNFTAKLRNFGQRYKTSAARFSLPLLLLLFVLCGSFVFYNTNILNKYRTPKAERQLNIDYELLYKKYENKPQPRIVSSVVAADIYPDTRQLDFKGVMIIKNKNNTPIDSVIVQLPNNAQINSLSVGKNAKLVLNDPDIGFYIYQLAQPLQPADSIELSYNLHYGEKGFPNNGGTTSIVENGTFVNSSLLPSIGYSNGGELQDPDERRKAKLPKRANDMPPATDSTNLARNYISSDSDWIRFDATVSTSPDQIAIAPGYLQREWTENGRKYFHYKMDRPILNFYSFLSARYQVLRDKWNDINIEIYYHPQHTYNIDRMVAAVKKTLDYCSKNFSPYQHKQVRIIEFPRYASFAQSFPNTIPFSESIGFILDIDPETNIDFATYVTAHEVAHQWWAHQVIGANVEGATITSETMAQYSAIMVMEHEYGKGMIENFLKYELDSYLRGRARETKAENPLMYNQNQPYIHYRKGSLAMYALKDYIGEDKLNAALKSYVQKVAYQEAPYTTSIEFVDYLRKATPDSLQYLIKDLFETITLYGNETKKATYKANANNTFTVSMDIAADKFRSDSLGVETKVPFKDWIDVGVYAKGKNDKDTLIYLQKHLISKSQQTILVTVTQQPTKCGIDPLHILIDRDSDDNTKTVSKE